jgi:hypothetical protein
VPEDFRVEELLGFAPDGSGAHLLLHVEKRGANSGWVAAALARAAQVASRDVGLSGHKDRDAVTRQYYSLPASARAPVGGWTGFEGEGFRVLEAAPHGRKLRIGTHRANRFRIAIRDVSGTPMRSRNGCATSSLAASPIISARSASAATARTCGSRARGPRPDRRHGNARREASRCPRRGAGSSMQSWPDACRTAAGTGCCRAMRRCWMGAEAGSA